MKPLREEAGDELELQAADLIVQGSELPGWRPGEKEAGWERIAAAARAREPAFWPRLGWPLQLALAGSFAMLALALVLPRFNARGLQSVAPAALPAHSAASTSAADTGDLQSVAPAALPAHSATLIPVDLGSVGKLRVDLKAVYRLPAAAGGDYRIGLDDGTLCAEVAHRDPATQGPLSVQTPQFEVLVIGTSFCVEVRQGISRVSVTQGRVRVQAPSGIAFVGAGETLGSNDPRLSAARELAPSVAASARPLANRASAPTPAAPSAPLASSLAEQNALYAKAALARDRHDGAGAIAAWTSFLQQFPQGVLAPEAATGILSELVDESRDREALASADDYLARFPADGRAAEVAYIRGNLLREKLGRTSDALAAYRQALALASSPRLKDDALFAVAACQRMLGYTAAARETFKQYQTEFPGGVHAGELSRWLGEAR